MDSKNTNDNSKIHEKEEQSNFSNKETQALEQTENSSEINLVPNSNLSSKVEKTIENKNKEQNDSQANEQDKSDGANKDNQDYLKDIELIQEIKSENYKRFYKKNNLCDFRKGKSEDWKIGIIIEMSEVSIIVNDIEKNKERIFKIEDSKKISYFRKYSEPSNNNFYEKRDSKSEIIKRLSTLEELIKDDKNNIFNKNNPWDIYYCLHSEIFFGLDYAMKINKGECSYNKNEGAEESFRIILCILFFISKYFKYILDNKDEFINYYNNIVNTDFSDIKIINKKFAFFSFFGESLNLLGKILCNEKNYLEWYIAFEEELLNIIPSIKDKETQPNPEFYPLYEEKKEENEENKEQRKEGELKEENKKKKEENPQISEKDKDKDNKDALLLKRICLKQAYKSGTTFTTQKTRIKAAIVAYFIDYFHFFNGFSYLYKLCYCSKSIKLDLLKILIDSIVFARAMTKIYENNLLEEKKQLLQFITNLISNLNEKVIMENKDDDIPDLINKIPDFIDLEEKESKKLIENLYLDYIFKTLIFSKDFEQKLISLKKINDILKTIRDGDRYSNFGLIKIKSMTCKEFCLSCNKNKILQNLLNDKNVNEEVIKLMSKIIFVMYENNFGYSNKEDEDKIKFYKNFIFDSLFNKLIDSIQNNEVMVINIQNIICDFSVILSDEDKLYVYQEIKKYIEKSIEKKGMPMKVHLLFIIDYSLRAITSKNKEGKKEEEKDNKFDENKEKLKNIKLDEDKYYGLNLLLDYLSEEIYKKYCMTNEQKIELINASMKGIIQIINNCDKKDLLIKYIFLKIISAINSSKDVIQYLVLFGEIKNNRAISDCKTIEDDSKNNELLHLLMLDINRYLSSIKENEEDLDKAGKKIYEGLYDNKKNINLRFKLLFDLLKTQMNEDNLNNFFNLIKSCGKNKFANDCLNQFIYNNIKEFDTKFMDFYYDNILLSKENLSKTNDLEYYNLCIMIIKEINKNNKKFYFMNGKDLAIINCESEKEIKGIDLLWNFLLKTKNDEIRNNSTDLLADIFFGIRISPQEKMENYWKNFIKSIYDKLEYNNDKDNKNENEQSNQRIIFLIKKIQNKFSNSGDIISSINQISKESKLNKKEQSNKRDIEYKRIYYSGTIYNKDKKVDYDSRIDSTEYFYMFRYKLSLYFKMPVNLVKVVVDESKYEKKMEEELKNIKFDLFNDFDNTYTLLENIEHKIYGKNNNDNENLLILRIEVIEKNEKLEYIKKFIKDFPKLINLLKRKNSDYLLDVWCLIKDNNNLKISPKIIQIIKDALKKPNSDSINSLFNFEDTSIYYISYILFHLSDVINELNKKNDKFINNVFLKSKIWNEKLKYIKLENSNKPYLGELYEKNNIINYLLNIFKIISGKTNDKNILAFILKKIFEFYYETIKEIISIYLNTLPSTEGVKVEDVENLYLTNITIINDIIIKNNEIYNMFILILLNTYNLEKDNKIRVIFEFLFMEGLLKNKIYSINQQMKFFLFQIVDIEFFGKNCKENKKLIQFYNYILNLFLSPKNNKIFIGCMKDLSLDKQMDQYLNIEKFENNIILYFDIITEFIDTRYLIINNTFNFKPYINEVCLPGIFNPIIDDISQELPYHEIIFGGHCKILFYLLSKEKNYKELLNMKDNEEKELKLYLFNEIIMSKCNKNIFTEKNIDNYKSITISKPFTFQQAVKLFIFLVMKNIQNESEVEISYYFNKLTELHKLCNWKGNNMSDWKLDYKDNNRLAPFVGLKNLGCTCYMNSLLQVFFNIIPFRESLLRCKCKEEKKNALYQLKKVFYSLKYLQINYYTPTDFTNNYDNSSLNVHLQMDADEFFGDIIDKIESRLKNTNNENLVKYFFQGIQNDNLTFKGGCTHHRTNINNFYSIQLQIQNKKNIYESLDTFTEGEIMNGNNCIFCPQCNKKLPAIKSQNFKILPRILMFVLKRFEFDYSTERKIKINDYFEFPLELDMTKYMSQSNKDENLNKYRLKSVVVHMGNCEGGHYYAYIKGKNEQWYEFNDTQVTPFDINYLKEETFGGMELYEDSETRLVSEKNRSAYLLFYEKIIKDDCQNFDKIEAINSFLGKNDKSIQENNLKNDDDDNFHIIQDTKENEENKYGKKDILISLNEEMFKYFLNKKLFSNEYQYFILELYLNVINYYYSYDLPVFLMHLCRNTNNKDIMRGINSQNSNLLSYANKGKLVFFTKEIKTHHKPNSEQILNIFKHFIIYFYNILLRTKEKEYLGGMVDLIKFLINDYPICANYLIEEFCNNNTIVEYLVNCPIYEIKKLIVGILYCAMFKSVSEYELLKIKQENSKKMNSKKEKKKTDKNKSKKSDEEIARELSKELNGDKEVYIFGNPLEYENIPKNILKMIYNILYLIRDMGYNKMNEQRFLYFTIYRFSLISFYTREFLVNKCRLFELLCLLLHKKHATYKYDTKEIINSTNIGPYTVEHNILNTTGKKEDETIVDKGGIYRIENYIYMLFFNLLSYTPKKNSKSVIKEDVGYSLDNKAFVLVLLNNIRTKEDAFCFSNYINEKSKNNKNRIISVFEALLNYLDKIDNNENINYDFNNYNNFEGQNSNENPSHNDPGMNPKYFFLIFKRFLSSQNPKADYIQKGIKIIFRVFWSNQRYYNYCIMLMDFILELFSKCLRVIIPAFKKDLEQLMEWLEQNPIAPTLYPISGISLYKTQHKNYDSNISDHVIKDFEGKEIEKTQKRIEEIKKIINNKSDGKNEEFNIDIDFLDFKFIIGDHILYDNKEAIVQEALDELIKISIEVKNADGTIKEKEMWIETDNPKIEIKDL